MMIHITNTKTDLNIEGHAQNAGEPYRLEGRDACASVTALAHSTLGSIQQIAGCFPRYEFERGHFWMDKTELNETAKLFIDDFIIGAGMLAKAYGDYLELVDAGDD